MSTKRILPDDRLLAAITPQTTQVGSPLCYDLRRAYEIMPARGKIKRSDLMELTGWKHKKIQRTLGTGVKLGIWDRHIRGNESDLYSRNPAGLKALVKAKKPAAASPLERLSPKHLTALMRVDWEKINVTRHQAWHLACLIAVIGRGRRATQREFELELRCSPSPVYNTRILGCRLKILVYKSEKGVGGQSNWSVDWIAIEKLPRVAAAHGQTLEPRISTNRWEDQRTKSTSIQGLQRDLLNSVDWRKTDLKNLYRWERVKELVAVVGSRWEKSHRALAASLETTVETIERSRLPWAMQAGVVKVTPRSGNVAGTIEVLWDEIKTLAGEQPKAERNGHAAHNGAPKPKGPEMPKQTLARALPAGRKATLDHICKWTIEFLEAAPDKSHRDALNAYHDKFPEGKLPLDKKTQTPSPKALRAAVLRFRSKATSERTKCPAE